MAQPIKSLAVLPLEILSGYPEQEYFADGTGLDPATDSKPQAKKSPTDKIMLAVLPFENLSADSEQEWFSDGMTEEMIVQLGRLQPKRLGSV